MHFHAYGYRGPGEAVRPYDTVRSPSGSGFETSPVPPERTSAWLAKPARFIRGTWDDPADAVAWLEGQHAELEPLIAHPDLRRHAPTVRAMAATALDTLRRGNDVVWAWWLTGGNFASVAVICCPNRDLEARCPLDR
ncbi:hypothetical protein [Actinoallomurus rhizosphaericola]|uniref:hypothetical protein n=1 Tax=Actinoallomurus rhizosphaericola TaxID=2952536 RepID=UPI002093CA5F|nr:hypothetical protein [Actinoallomurus rhizosphaericola]MCO5996250.1 hypothetical protein [Actinoallomurus rhizosphaericola]